MIKKLVRQMLTAQIISALTVSMCLLIDNIMIGRYLGEEALAAYGLANPLLLVIGAIGSLLAAGIQVACSKSLGMGSQEETNAGYSSALALGGGVSVVFMVIVLLFRSPLATVLGAGREGTLFEQTRDYLAGFCIGAPGSMGALVLVPFLQMAGQSNLLIVAVLSMTLADVALDLLNVLVFHGGMFGMGLASSLSYYIAMIFAAIYFLSKKCVFRFSAKGCSWKKMAELLRGGIPTGFNMLSSVLLVFGMNQLLTRIGGSAQVAAYSVISTLGGAANCITTGIAGVTLTLAGIFSQEEDRGSLLSLMKLLFRDAVMLGVVMGAIVFFVARPAVSLFIPQAGNTQDMAILGFRFFGCGILFSALNNALKNAWQASGKVLLTEIASMIEGAVMPLVCAAVFSRLMGQSGAWLFFSAGELLTLLCLGIYISIQKGQAPWKDGAYLLLPEDFGGKAEDALEMDLKDMNEVMTAVRKAEGFCILHGQDAKDSNHVALCIEEMAGNIIEHGFAADAKEHHLSVRLLFREDHWLLRFRDDCAAFDPVHYVPEDPEGAIGIRLVQAMASEVTYTYSLNLNNLTLKFLLPENA